MGNMPPALNHEQTAAGRLKPFPFWRVFLLLSLLCVALTPPLVLTLCLLNAGYSPGATLSLLLEQSVSARRNLWLVGLPALLPFALLAILLAIYRRWRGPEGSIELALGGGLSIVILLLWANASFWPLFMPGREYPGFPHGLEMVIVPIFFAPIGMLVGLALAAIWLHQRR